MENAGDAIAIAVNGDEISLHDLLATAKFRGRLDFIAETVDAVLIRGAAARMQLEVSDAECQAEADEFRARRQLYEAQKTEAWLAAHHLAQEDWELQLEDGILRRKLRQLLTADRIDQYFAENKRAWDAATVSRIVVTDENIGLELRAQAMEGEAGFHELARRHSVDEATRHAGGHTGRVRRQDLDAMLAASIFGAQPGEVTGPVSSDQGWHLFLVEALHPAQRDRETREAIAEALLADWLTDERKRADIKAHLLDF